MAITLTVTNHFKYQLLMGQVDLNSDTIKAILAREDFVFDQDVYASYINLKATTESISLEFDGGDSTITRTSGSFITDGFVVGNQIYTTSGDNPGPFTVTAVVALILTVSETLIDQTLTCAVTATDETATIGGYIQNTKTLSTQAITEDDANDRCHFTCDNISWTGTVDGFTTAGCFLIDDTPAADADKTIIAYLNFDGNRTISEGGTLPLNDIVMDITYTASGTTYTVTPSNHFLYQLADKKIDVDSDSFKLCLMTTGYTFDRDAHATWADVSASELAAGNGYTQDTVVLTTPVVTENDTSNYGQVVFDTVVIQATGGSIGLTPGAIIYDDTTSDNTIVGFWKFPAETIAYAGETHTFVGITFRNA